jgi:hypothetical protein
MLQTYKFHLKQQRISFLRPEWIVDQQEQLLDTITPEINELLDAQQHQRVLEVLAEYEQS